MKKILCATLFLFASYEAHTQCTPDFYDGFESGSYSPAWAVGSDITGAVTTTNPAAGVYRLEGTGGNLTHLNGFSTTFAAATPTTMSWWIYTNGSGSIDYLVAGNASVSATNCIVFSYYAGASGSIRFVASINYDYPASTNTWYHIELRNINWSSHTSDIYINNSLISASFPFRSSSQNNVSKVHLYNYNSGLGVWDDVQIGGGNMMTLSNTITPVSCNSGTTGAIDLSVSGGTSPYTYSWNNSAVTQDISGLAAGTYSVTVTDNIGCTNTATMNITEPSAITTSINSTNVNCFSGSDGAADLTVSGGTPGYTFLWSNSSATEDISGAGAGSYTVTVTDMNGCTGSAIATITEPAQLVATVTANMNVTCNGGNDGSATVSVSGGIGTYSYLWAPTAGTNPTESGLSAGSYNCTITDANGCTTNPSITITEPSVLAATITSADVMCNSGNNGSATINVSGGNGSYTYSWSSGGTSATEGGLTAGTFTCTVTDAGGCTISQSVTITEPTAISTSTITADVACNGSATGTASVTVTGGTPGYTFNWSNSDISGIADSLAAGNYFCMVTDMNGCTASVSVTITEPSPIMITFMVSNTTTCGGSDGAIDATINGGTVPYTYLWSNSNTTEDITGLTAGNYSLMITDNNGCTATNAIDVLPPSSPSVTLMIGNNSPCLNDQGFALSGGSPAGGSWSGSGVTGSTFDPSSAGVGNSVITYTYTDANNCIASATDTIMVNACTGVSEATLTAWSIYPNPNDGKFTIISNGFGDAVTFEVTDVQGRVVFSTKEYNVTPGFSRGVSLENVTSGMYLLRVINNYGSPAIYKLSVQR